MKAHLVLLALSLTCVFSVGANPPPGPKLCHFSVNADGSLECTREAKTGYCILRLSDLACLETAEQNHDPNAGPILLHQGEIVIWRGDHKMGSPCEDPTTGDNSSCPRFLFHPFTSVVNAGASLCGQQPAQSVPFVSDFSDEDPSAGSGTKRLQHSKATSVKIDPSLQGACYKHNILLDDNTQIDPHIMIGGVSLVRPGKPKRSQAQQNALPNRTRGNRTPNQPKK
jgi:hypothetical protein